MNHCYIILYDLISPGQDYNSLIEAIKSYGTWGKLTESAWAIVSSDSASSIAAHLRKYMDTNDRLVVILSGKEAAWYKAMANSEWLKTNLVK